MYGKQFRVARVEEKGFESQGSWWKSVVVVVLIWLWCTMAGSRGKFWIVC